MIALKQPSLPAKGPPTPHRSSLCPLSFLPSLPPRHKNRPVRPEIPEWSIGWRNSVRPLAAATLSTWHYAPRARSRHHPFCARKRVPDTKMKAGSIKGTMNPELVKRRSWQNRERNQPKTLGPKRTAVPHLPVRGRVKGHGSNLSQRPFTSGNVPTSIKNHMFFYSDRILSCRAWDPCRSYCIGQQIDLWSGG